MNMIDALKNIPGAKTINFDIEDTVEAMYKARREKIKKDYEDSKERLRIVNEKLGTIGLTLGDLEEFLKPNRSLL
jgi:hypothetical protein